MTIYKKDGTPYTLSKPNPLMINQNVADEGWYKLHNAIGGEEFVVEYNEHKKSKNILIPKEIEPTVVKPQEQIEEIEEIKKEPEKEVIELTKEEPKKEIPLIKIDNIPKLKEINGDIYHCLPAKIVEYHDEIYDEYVKRTVYQSKEKFSIELRKNGGNDMGLKLISNKELSQGSILFSTLERRWWKITHCFKQTNDLYLISVIPSLEQPSFD